MRVVRTAHFPLTFCLLFSFTCTPIAYAQQSSSFNPFADSDAEEDRTVDEAVSDEPAGFGFSLPSLPAPPSLPTPPPLPKFKIPKWNWMSRPEPEPTGPSTWEKLNRGTKSFFAKTQATLMPWTIDEGRRDRHGYTRSRRMADRRNRDDEGLFSLFRSNREEKEIRSVNDYLSLPRPSP